MVLYLYDLHAAVSLLCGLWWATMTVEKSTRVVLLLCTHATWCKVLLEVITCKNISFARHPADLFGTRGTWCADSSWEVKTYPNSDFYTIEVQQASARKLDMQENNQIRTQFVANSAQKLYCFTKRFALVWELAWSKVWMVSINTTRVMAIPKMHNSQISHSQLHFITLGFLTASLQEA